MPKVKLQVTFIRVFSLKELKEQREQEEEKTDKELKGLNILKEIVGSEKPAELKTSKTTIFTQEIEIELFLEKLEELKEGFKVISSESTSASLEMQWLVFSDDMALAKGSISSKQSPDK